MLTLGIEDELTEEEELVCGNFLIFTVMHAKLLLAHPG